MLNIKIKKNTVYFVPGSRRERSEEHEAWLLALQHLWCNEPCFGF